MCVRASVCDSFALSRGPAWYARKLSFYSGRVPIVSRESIMKLARIIHDGSLRNRAVDGRDRRAELRGREAYLK
jgi:hypothetical protein